MDGDTDALLFTAKLVLKGLLGKDDTLLNSVFIPGRSH